MVLTAPPATQLTTKPQSYPGDQVLVPLLFSFSWLCFSSTFSIFFLPPNFIQLSRTALRHRFPQACAAATRPASIQTSFRFSSAHFDQQTSFSFIVR